MNPLPSKICSDGQLAVYNINVAFAFWVEVTIPMKDEHALGSGFERHGRRSVTDALER